MPTSYTNTYKWEGKMQTLRSILKGVHDSGKYPGLSLESFRYRIGKTKGNVAKALCYAPVKNHNTKKAAKIKCPDGIVRSHPQIAEHLGISRPGWYGRYSRYGIDVAWGMGPARSKHASRTPRPKQVTPFREKLDAEQQRQQDLLNKIPSPTKFDKEMGKVRENNTLGYLKTSCY